MYIIEVIPLVLLPPQTPQVLSYFFDRELPKGALVRVPLGKRSVAAIVIGAVPLASEKAALKQSTFELKRIDEVLVETPQVSSSQFKLASWIAQEYYAPLGLALKTVLPSFLGKKNFPLEVSAPPTAAPAVPKPLFIQSRPKDLLRHLEPLLSPVIKKRGQVLLLAPDRALLEFYYEKLRPEFPEITAVHANLPSRALYERWNSVASGKTNLVIGTRAGLFFPFSDLRLVIVLEPSHEGYKSDMTPRYHAADLATKRAELSGAHIVFASSFRSTSEHHQINQGAYDLAGTSIHSSAVITITDMVQELRNNNFSLLSRQFQARLTEALERHEWVLVFSARRAYAGILLCQNCGISFPCANCSIPMRVHKMTESMLVCYRCMAYRDMPSSCPNCNSYQLKPTGAAGSQKIQEDLERFLAGPSAGEAGRAHTFILDSDLTRTTAQEQEVWECVRQSPDAILIATQMIFSYRPREHFDFIAIPNADALLQSFDFRTDERFLQQMEQLLDFEPSHILLQTFHPQNTLFRHVQEHTYEKFYEDELAARRSLAYPPFSRLVKLTFRHADNEKAFHAARVLSERLKMAIARLGFAQSVFILGPSPAAVAREKNLYFYHILLKITDRTQRLDAILKFVPSNWLIDVNPRSTA